MRHALTLPAFGRFATAEKKPAPVETKRALSVTALGVVGSLAAGIWSTPQSTYTIGIYGTVPTVCHAELKSAAVDTSEGLVDLGTMVEFCNNGNGYQVWLETTPKAPAGSIYVDNAKVPLSATGATLIHQSETAARRTSHLSLDTGNTRIEKVMVRIVPL